MTMNGSLPPSSSTAFLICAPAAPPTALPAPSLPVSVTAATRGSSISVATGPSRRAASGRRPPGSRRGGRSPRSPARSCGTFEACLSSPTLPAISAGRGEAEDLPEREVPGHDREHRPERLVADDSSRRASVGDRLVGQEALGVLGVEAADPGALLRLGHGRADGLAHLERHAAAPLGLADCRGSLLRRRSARRVRASSVRRQVANCVRARATRRSTSALGMRLELLEDLAVRGVDGSDGHVSSSARACGAARASRRRARAGRRSRGKGLPASRIVRLARSCPAIESGTPVSREPAATFHSGWGRTTISARRRTAAPFRRPSRSTRRASQSWGSPGGNGLARRQREEQLPRRGPAETSLATRTRARRGTRPSREFRLRRPP